MTNNVNESIEAVKKIINYTIDGGYFENRFLEYDQFYFWSNEDIRSCLKHFSLNGKNNGLTVLSSGDHPFNLITEGMLNIDTFDVNRLTEYFALGFKRAMILKYSYNEFLFNMKRICFFDLSFEELYEIVNGLLNYMEPEHKLFWQEVLKYTYNFQNSIGYSIDLFKLLVIDANYLFSFNIDACNYTKSEKQYNTLRKKLS